MCLANCPGVDQSGLGDIPRFRICNRSAARGGSRGVEFNSQRLDACAVAIRALLLHLFVDDHRFVRHLDFLRMTLIAGHMRVTTLKGKVGAGIVIERRRHPVAGIVTIVAGRPAMLGKLARMRVFVAVLTNFRSPFELNFLRADWRLVALPAFDRAVRAQQRELRFGVVKAGHIRPGSDVVARFAAKRDAVGAALGHTILELPFMRIGMARRASLICEMKRQDLVFAPGSAHLVAIRTGNRRVSARKRETSVAMLGDGKCGPMEI